MLIELHCHSNEHSMCSTVSAVDIIKRLLSKGLQGVVFTDHHYLWPDSELQTLRLAAGVPEYFLLLSGQEVTTCDYGDVLVFGADTCYPKHTKLEVIRLEQPDAAIVWAHPYRKGKQPISDYLCSPLFDGVEIFNTNHTVRENCRALQDWHEYRFTATCGTDTHAVSYGGLYPTQFDHPVQSVTELAREIRAGHCRPFMKEIPHAGANSQVVEVTIGTKGRDETRERIIIRRLVGLEKWRAADRAYQIMEQISSSGFCNAQFRIPRTFDCDTGSHTVIEEGIRGKSLFEMITNSSWSDGRYYLQLAARWLARLHCCRLQLTEPSAFYVKERRRLARYEQRFTDVSHRHVKKVQDMVVQIAAEETEIRCCASQQCVQGHGDYHPKNIIIGQDRTADRSTMFVAAIDFDSSYCMPQSFDVGCFLAQYRNQFFHQQHILSNIPEHIFLDAYVDAYGAPADGFLRQVELFRARTNLGIAAYLIKLGLGDSENLWRVLVEAEQILSCSVASRA